MLKQHVRCEWEWLHRPTGDDSDREIDLPPDWERTGVIALFFFLCVCDALLVNSKNFVQLINLSGPSDIRPGGGGVPGIEGGENLPDNGHQC